MMKKLLSLLLTCTLLLALLVGCGSKATAPQASGGNLKAESSMDYSSNMEFGFMEAPAPEAEEMAPMEDAISGSLVYESLSQTQAKMIYRATMELQTLDFETSEHALSALVSSCGGYFENRSLSNRSSGYRYGDFTVRVPVAEYEHFCSQVGELCHVTYMTSSAENISEQYYDTESRLETAKIKLERLQELLGKADNMADIITIESSISETEYQIEKLSGTLRHYDALVDFATVYLTLNEVYKLSGTETAPETFGDRMANAFVGGLEDAVDFFEDLAVSFASSWLFLLIFVGAAYLVIRVVRRKIAALRAKRHNNLTDTNGEK